jgi:hypothetical protein
MDKTKVVAEGILEGSKMYFRKIDTKEKRGKIIFLNFIKKLKSLKFNQTF